MVLIRQSVRVSGLSALAITKLDVLGGIEKLKVCIGYKAGNETYTEAVPSSLRVLAQCEPIYEEVDGWTEDISKAKSLNDLPANAKKYLEKISELSGVPLCLVSVGAGRYETIVVNNPFI
jgi:adenylosuccinate synthase